MPSPDVEIKAELLKALSQALVPLDHRMECSPALRVVAKSFAQQLQDLTDMDSSAPQFSIFSWNLKTVTWVSDGSMAENGLNVRMDSSLYSDEEKISLEKQTADASPDAGWVRLAAAKSLFRLFSFYDSSFDGNDYLGLGLACQDSMVEVRRDLLKKIHSTVNSQHKLGKGGSRKVMAKLAALYALYAADPFEPNVKNAFHHLREYVVTRRSILNKIALSKSSTGASGALIIEMPEFLLPYLVFFMSHHPDYDAEAMADTEHGGDAIMALFRDSIEFALEVLMLPRSSDQDSKTTSASELSNHAGVALKLLRRLKYCDVLGVEEEEDTDEMATLNAHQICDIGLSLTRHLLLTLSPVPKTVPSKFSGSINLPRKLYRTKPISNDDKRMDGSDLPDTLKAPKLRDLFSATFGAPLAIKAVKRGRRKGGKGKDQVVEQGPRKAPKQDRRNEIHPSNTIQEDDKKRKSNEMDASARLEDLKQSGRTNKKQKDSIDELFTSSDDEEIVDS